MKIFGLKLENLKIKYKYQNGGKTQKNIIQYNQILIRIKKNIALHMKFLIEIGLEIIIKSVNSIQY